MVKLVSVNEDFVSAMTLLGEGDEPSVAVKETLERLVCSLYQVKIDVNEARYKLFTKKKKPPPLQSLSTIKDVLYLHIEPASYQCQLWKKALDYHPHLPHPVEHGWTDIDGSLTVQWGYLKPAPDFILEFVSCSCKKFECTTNHCSCAAVNLPCTDLFCCTNCKNNDSQEGVDVNEIFNDDDELVNIKMETLMKK